MSALVLLWTCLLGHACALAIPDGHSRFLADECTFGDDDCIKITGYTDSSCTNLDGSAPIIASITQCDDTCTLKNGLCLANAVGSYGAFWNQDGQAVIKLDCANNACGQCQVDIVTALPSACLRVVASGTVYYAKVEGTLPKLPCNTLSATCLGSDAFLTTAGGVAQNDPSCRSKVQTSRSVVPTSCTGTSRQNVYFYEVSQKGDQIHVKSGCTDSACTTCTVDTTFVDDSKCISSSDGIYVRYHTVPITDSLGAGTIIVALLGVLVGIGILIAAFVFIRRSRNSQGNTNAGVMYVEMRDDHSSASLPPMGSHNGVVVHEAVHEPSFSSSSSASLPPMGDNGDVFLGCDVTIDYQELQRATNNFDSAFKIGDGGSCIVFKANLFGDQCAIKLLPKDVDSWGVEQFETEVRLLARVHHPNLCRLYACSTNGPQRGVVLELMDGALDNRLLSHPPLSWQQRVFIALACCRALVHLHSQSPPVNALYVLQVIDFDPPPPTYPPPTYPSRPPPLSPPSNLHFCNKVIHRDVKCQNVLLVGFKTSLLDDTCVVKVSDFGTARIDDRNSEGRVPSESGMGMTGSTTVATSNISKYSLGHEAAAGKVAGIVIAIRPDTPGATTGPGKLDIRTLNTGDADAACETHAVTKRVVGSGPYMPSEYVNSGHVSEKTDAFAFGVVLIELLISGAIEAQHSVHIARQARDRVSGLLIEVVRIDSTVDPVYDR
jgi:serine/threonine protein kinase